MHTINMSKYNLQTDLILEQINDEVSKKIKKTKYEENSILVEKVKLLEDINKYKKKKGDYITITFKDITDKENKENVLNIFQKELKELLEDTNIKDNYSCLVIGLGNKNSTPDALGPLVIDKILVTRHIYIMKEPLEDGYRITSKITPNVMGESGIETSDVIKGIINNTKPDFIIVIDALKASNVDRVLSTIQMTNTGINPGSGIGNKRKELSSATLNIPVISIGIPTIVDAASIVMDTIKYLFKKISYDKKNMNKNSNKLSINKNYINEEDTLNKNEKNMYFGLLGNLNEDELYKLFTEVLNPIGYNLMVTPKEIDFQLEKLSQLISEGINKALHKSYK